MDPFEATRVVFSRIQSLDPENAAKIMGLLLMQDHGEKEMIRLAFGPEALLRSVVLKARKELGLLPPSAPVSPSSPAPPSPFLLPRQGSRLLPASWPPPPAFSRTNGNALLPIGAADEPQSSPDEIISPANGSPSPFYGGGGGGDLFDEFLLQDQLSFLNDGNHTRGSQMCPKEGELFYPETGGECRSPSGNGEGMPFPYSMGWGPANGGGSHRRNCYLNDLCLGSDAAASGWKPCLYYARGYCKNGSSCRFLHGFPDDAAVAVEQQCQELLLRSKSQRLVGATPVSQMMASTFPYPSTGQLPPSPPGKCMNFPLQLQNESQRATALMLGGDDAHKFMGRARFERGDLMAMGGPGSRQIYLTFPADSTFREEDVSKYFSTYGPVQDVRIPYQQKRMFGFVTFVHPDTVKLILSKGNPHFVCEARVLVKPYKEKGKLPDKKQQQQAERGEFAGCPSPTGLDSRDPYDLSQLGARMLYNKSSMSTQEAILRRRLGEEQQAAELQQAIELQGRRFMGLHLLNLNTSNHINNSSKLTISTPPLTPSNETSNHKSTSQEGARPPPQAAVVEAQSAVNAAAAAADDKESTPDDDSGFQESLEHSLPDSPFASATKASLDSFAPTDEDLVAAAVASPLSNTNAKNNHHLMGSSSTLLPPSPTLDMASYNSCFFQMPRFSGHGAIGM